MGRCGRNVPENVDDATLDVFHGPVPHTIVSLSDRRFASVVLDAGTTEIATCCRVLGMQVQLRLRNPYSLPKVGGEVEHVLKVLNEPQGFVGRSQMKMGSGVAGIEAVVDD